MTPNADGFYTDFVNDYTNIDELGYDSSDAITTAALSQRQSWDFAVEPFVLGDKAIYGVIMNNVTQRDIAGSVNDFQPFLRILSTDYAGDNMNSDNIAPTYNGMLWTSNPATAQPWIEGDISGIEAGVLTV